MALRGVRHLSCADRPERVPGSSVLSVRRSGAVTARPPEMSRLRLETPGRSVILFSPVAQGEATCLGRPHLSWARQPLTAATLLRRVAIRARFVPIAARANSHSRAQISAQISLTIHEAERSDLTGHLVRLIENLEMFAETRRPRRTLMMNMDRDVAASCHGDTSCSPNRSHQDQLPVGRFRGRKSTFSRKGHFSVLAFRSRLGVPGCTLLVVDTGGTHRCASASMRRFSKAIVAIARLSAFLKASPGSPSVISR